MSHVEKHEPRRANDNPWYCLATLYGESAAEGGLDEDIAAQNRMAWNRWMAAVLSPEERAGLVRNGFSVSELAPLTPEEKSAFCNDFASRTGREGGSPPNPATDVVDFTNTHFDNSVFSGAFLYAANADFRSATFFNDANFSSAIFFGDANFDSSTFRGDVNFEAAKFLINADFKSARFSGNANFESASFREADLESATFFGHASFESATISFNVNFKSVKFFSNTNFRSVTFSGNADFRSAAFSGYADFESATFSGEVDFESVTFSGRAYFGSAAFSDHTDFGSATFSGDADFDSAAFLSNAGFRSVRFSRDIDFSSAKFFERADFINAEFTAYSGFAHVRFDSDVPDFRGAKMHEATAWHGVQWPPAPHDKDAAQAQVYAYERLKQEMERLKKHEDEQFFFRKELRARRGLVSRSRAAWLLNYLYEASSNYGQSIGRPFLWLFGLFAIGSAFFAGTPVFNGTRMPIPRAAWLSFANIFFIPACQARNHDS
jgi:uncharacterized protein YjbI with pentapeptide repeats